MKSMKKMLSMMMAVVILMCSFGICNTQAKSQMTLNNIPVTVEGSIFGGSSTEPIQTEVAYDASLLIHSNNKKYNSTIAGLSAILCADSYYREKDLAKGSQNRVLVDGEDASSYAPGSLLKKMGFDEVEYLETFKAEKYDYDSNDSATLLMAHDKVDDKYDAFVFIARGCFSQQEWLSVFDPGADTASYEEVTGQHPEWTKRSQNKGVSIAASRAYHFMQKFMETYGDDSRENVVLMTGHSRGGAIANLLGAQMEKEKKVKSFTYTFNTPGVDTKAIPGMHKTVYNIIESKDMFLDPLPFKTDKFRRYGTDVRLWGMVREAKLAKTFYHMAGRQMPEGLTMKEMAEYKKLFSRRFKNRASLYKMKTITEVFQEEEEAQERYERCVNLIDSTSGLGLAPYCSVNEVEKVEDGYVVTLNYCDAAWLVCYAKTLAYGASAHDATVELFAPDVDGCKVADFYAEHAAKINAGHLLARTYLISQLAAK